MKIFLAPEFTAKFPEYIRGIVIARGINNAGEHAELLARLRDAERAVRADALLQKNPAEHPRIASWREAFRRFGARPADDRPSIDALLRRVAKAGETPYINTLVALMNLVTLRFLIPCGGDDLDQVEGDFGLKIATGAEPFTPFNNPDALEHPEPGEVILADARKVMCRKWIWRQGDQTKLLPTTRNVQINIDILPPATRDEGETAARALAEWIREFCGGEVTRAFLDKDHPGFQF
jgi:lysyl-tRNA synthetase class 2